MKFGEQVAARLRVMRRIQKEPQDVVAKAVMRRMRESGAEHVWLDATAFGAAKWERRFPTILATCRAHGVDPVTEPIPVAPACHYASGGVATDLCGESSIPGLFACGEVACSGVHGAMWVLSPRDWSWR